MHLHFYAPKQKKAGTPVLCPRFSERPLFLRDLLLLALWRIKIFTG